MKLDSLIAGLTMLRAYGAEGVSVQEPCSIGAAIEVTGKFHASDIERMKHEGWILHTGPDGEWWEFQCD